MTCTNCGAELLPNARFCNACGAPVPAAAPIAPQGAPPPQAAPAPTVCPQCGAAVAAGLRFCNACGAPLPSAPAPSAYAPQQGYAPYGAYPQPPYPVYYQRPPEPDEPNTGLNVLGFFFPIIGLILYAVWNSTTPLRAKAILKWSVIGLVVSAAIAIITIIAIFAFSASMLDFM